MSVELVAGAVLLLVLAGSHRTRNNFMVESWKFDDPRLTFNGRATIGMSADLARGIQRMREDLGAGNITHVGVYNDRWARTGSLQPIYVNGRRLVSGHAWADAIDMKTWGTHGLDEIERVARIKGLRVVRYSQHVHIEVNYPHYTFPEGSAHYGEV